MINIAKKIWVKNFYPFLFIGLLFLGCEFSKEKSASNFSVVRSPIEIHFEEETSKYALGDTISLNVTCVADSLSFESIEVYLGDSLISGFNNFPQLISFSTTPLRLGKHKVKVMATATSSVESKSSSFTLLSNKAPEQYTYKVKQVFTHDKKAYTQGLFYYDGYLYEGTGQKGLSSVRKVELESGKVLEQVNNENSIFGEGIALLDNKIYQLSWISNVGFIYDSKSFELLNKFYYDGEGWGLTTDGKVLYRTDGSNKLYVHKPENFELVDVIEIYSDKEAIDNLNELEYIDGLIYANIWQKDDIAIIDPISGKLEGLINFKNLLPPNERDSRTDVLNGIAYDVSGNRLFVTGKNWPKLFQVEILEKAL